MQRPPAALVLRSPFTSLAEVGAVHYPWLPLRRLLLGVDRAHRLDAQIERRGLWAVVGQRFVPGISDALASYTFGAFGVPLWQMVVGSFIGSAPRVFVYTALGASIGDRSPLLASCAIAVWCVTAIF